MKKLILLILILPIFTVSAYGEALQDEIIMSSGLDEIQKALPEKEREISGELKLDGSYDFNSALKRLGAGFTEKIKEALKSELGIFTSLMAVIFICSIGASLSLDGAFQDYMQISGCCFAAYMLSSSVRGIISQAVSAVNQLSDYSRAALPALFTASAACGSLGSAPIKYAAAYLAIELFMSAAREIILPLINAYIAISLSSSLFENELLKTASRMCSKLCGILMSGLCLAFGAYISLSGLIAGSSDALAVKAAKSIISSTLPVVGRVLSDSASLVVASATLIKNSAGIFCLICVCALCLGPFVSLGIKSLLFKFSSCAAKMLPGSKLSSLLSSLGTAMSLLLGLVGSCGIMLLISIMSAMKVMVL